MKSIFGWNAARATGTGLGVFILVWAGRTLWCTITGWFTGGLPAYSCFPVSPIEAEQMMVAQGFMFFGVPIIAACGKFVIYVLRPKHEGN